MTANLLERVKNLKLSSISRFLKYYKFFSLVYKTRAELKYSKKPLLFFKYVFINRFLFDKNIIYIKKFFLMRFNFFQYLLQMHFRRFISKFLFFFFNQRRVKKLKIISFIFDLFYFYFFFFNIKLFFVEEKLFILYDRYKSFFIKNYFILFLNFLYFYLYYLFKKQFINYFFIFYFFFIFIWFLSKSSMYFLNYLINNIIFFHLLHFTLYYNRNFIYKIYYSKIFKFLYFQIFKKSLIQLKKSQLLFLNFLKYFLLKIQFTFSMEYYFLLKFLKLDFFIFYKKLLFFITRKKFSKTALDLYNFNLFLNALYKSTIFLIKPYRHSFYYYNNINQYKLLSILLIYKFKRFWFFTFYLKFLEIRSVLKKKNKKNIFTKMRTFGRYYKYMRQQFKMQRTFFNGYFGNIKNFSFKHLFYFKLAYKKTFSVTYGKLRISKLLRKYDINRIRRKYNKQVPYLINFYYKFEFQLNNIFVQLNIFKTAIIANSIIRAKFVFINQVVFINPFYIIRFNDIIQIQVKYKLYLVRRFINFFKKSPKHKFMLFPKFLCFEFSRLIFTFVCINIPFFYQNIKKVLKMRYLKKYRLRALAKHSLKKFPISTFLIKKFKKKNLYFYTKNKFYYLFFLRYFYKVKYQKINLKSFFLITYLLNFKKKLKYYCQSHLKRKKLIKQQKKFFYGIKNILRLRNKIRFHVNNKYKKIRQKHSLLFLKQKKSYILKKKYKRLYELKKNKKKISLFFKLLTIITRKLLKLNKKLNVLFFKYKKKQLKILKFLRSPKKKYFFLNYFIAYNGEIYANANKSFNFNHSFFLFISNFNFKYR
jgi:hypothetical protein